MRGLANSMLATLFVLALLLVLPLIAVFGIPEFVPAVASSSSGADSPFHPLRPENVGVGQSAGYVANDLFADFPDAAETGGESFATADGRSEFDVQHAFAVESAPRPTVPSDVPLDGWEFDDRGRARPAAATAQSRSELLAAARTEAGKRGFRAGDSVSVHSPATVRPEQPSNGPAAPAWERESPRAPAEPLADNAGQQRFRRERDTPASGQSASTSPGDPPNASRPAGPVEDLDWAAAIARLREHGIRDYTLTPGSDGREFHFACVYTPQGGSRVTHRFEAEAADPLLAVREVLVQIDDWTARRR